MSLETLRDAIPDYAKDQRINLGNVRESEHLDPVALWGTLVATAAATRNARLVAAAVADAAEHLDEPSLAAAKGAAAVMGMNNVYYRFRHLASNEAYGSMPARLRMQIIARPGVDKKVFELWCLAVSAINGCAACVDAHEKVVLDQGLTEAAVHDAVRIASVMHAVAIALDTEEALAAG